MSIEEMAEALSKMSDSEINELIRYTADMLNIDYNILAIRLLSCTRLKISED